MKHQVKVYRRHTGGPFPPSSGCEASYGYDAIVDDKWSDMFDVFKEGNGSFRAKSSVIVGNHNESNHPVVWDCSFTMINTTPDEIVLRLLKGVYTMIFDESFDITFINEEDVWTCDLTKKRQ